MNLADLDHQWQTLIEQAPPDLHQALLHLGPLFKAWAQPLRHATYFILRSPDQAWVTTTLQRGTVTKTVLYAFGTFEDALSAATAKMHPHITSEITPQPIPTLALLFQLQAIAPQVDSLIFLESPGQKNAVEVVGQELRVAIQSHLREPIA